MSETGLFRLVYVSTADAALNEDESLLRALAEQAATRNANMEVTGLLLFNGLNFLQVLEGTQDAVEAVYADIAEDTRHSGVATVLTEEIDARAFPNWSMKMTIVPSTAGEPIVPSVTQEELVASLPETVPALLKRILTSFNTVLA